LSDPVEQERLQVLEESEGLRDRVDADEDRRKAALRAQLSVRDRLMRRVQVTRFKTVFEDDLGDFVVETRQMTSGERFQAVQLNQLLAQSDREPEKYAEAIGGFRELARELCVTPGLDDYWNGEGVSDDVVIAVVMSTLQQTMRLVGEALTSFRKE